MKYLQRIPIFSSQELRVSVAIAVLGFVLMWVVVPLQVRESGTPQGWMETYNAARAAGHFVVGVVALLCAFNALRKAESEPHEFDAIIIWSIILCVWMMLSLSSLLAWWQHLRPELRPPWLQNLM